MLAMPHWETVGITTPDEQVQSIWHALPAGHVPALPSQSLRAVALTVSSSHEAVVQSAMFALLADGQPR